MAGFVAGARRHQVELAARAEVGVVSLEVLRSSRRDAKGDFRINLTPSEARDLMRALQSAADEASRRAYVADHQNAEAEKTAIAAVAEQLEAAP